MMNDDMFDGFDHTVYKDEVEQRWGAEAYSRSDSWWRSLGTEQQAAWKNTARKSTEPWLRD